MPLADRTVLLAVPEADSRQALKVFEGLARRSHRWRTLQHCAEPPRYLDLRHSSSRTCVLAPHSCGPAYNALRAKNAVVVRAGTVTEEARMALLNDGADHVADGEARRPR